MTLQGEAKAKPCFQPRLFVRPDRAVIKISNTREVDLLPESIERSRLLSNIIDTCNSAPDCNAALDIDAEALQQWLSHVQPGALRPTAKSTKIDNTLKTSGTTDTTPRKLESPPQSSPSTRRLPSRQTPSRHAKRKAADESMALAVRGSSQSQGSPKVQKKETSSRQRAWALCLLIQASDVLMDEQTEAESCTALGAALEVEVDHVLERNRNRKPVIAGKVLAALSEDLAIKVLQAIHRPFSDLLRYLSTTPFRPHLLRALRPSIDASASFTLGDASISALAMPHLLEPIAALTHLQSLSFAGQPLVHLHGWVDRRHIDLKHVLCALPCLTHLCLRDTALRSCADALAAALPALPHLHTLDASNNRLDGVFDKLAAALPAATALRTLLLDGAASTARSLRELAAALWKIPQLEELSIGAPGPLQNLGEATSELKPLEVFKGSCELLVDVLAPLRSMEGLRYLD